jgi:hypothetical protein
MSGERNFDLQTVLFAVEKRPVYFRDARKDLFGNEEGDPTYHEVPRFVAVVDVERNYMFAVVSDQYRLVKNDEALKLGKQCFLRVFSAPTADGMEVFNIIQPNTRSFCHVDFIHKGRSLEPWRGDKWWPYLRVTNSYNRTKPLRFDLGFCRGICTNGVIFGAEHIVFRYYHTHDQIDVEGKFKVDATRLRKLETVFIEQMHGLKRYYVPQEHMLALACKAFDVGVTEEDLSKPRRRKQLLDFRAEITRLTAHYFKDLGPNGYAALNVLSDFATRPRTYISETAMIDPLQKRCGDLTVSFLQAIQERTFDYAKYLGPFAKAARILDGAEPRTI